MLSIRGTRQRDDSAEPPGQGVGTIASIIPSVPAASRFLPDTRKAGASQLVSYEGLAKALKQISLSPDQKKQLQHLVAVVFPKLAVYNSVDPSLAQPLLTLLQSSQDAVVLRFVYYFLGRILSESGGEGDGGGVPAPSWGFAGDEDEQISRAEAVSLILARLSTEAGTPEPGVHNRRVAALKALACAPTNKDDAYGALVGTVFPMLDSVSEGRKKRRRWSRMLLVSGANSKDAALRANVYYAGLSALRRLPMDATSAPLIEKVVLGIACPDPVGLRHALAMAGELARDNPVDVATSLATLAGGSLAQAIRSIDMFARVYLARLCGTLIHSPELYDKSDFRGLFSAISFQLLYDPEAKVCLEAVASIAGSFSAKVEPSTDQRADGWQILTTAVMDTRGAAREVGLQQQKAKEQMPVPPAYDLVLKTVTFRLELALRSPVRPMLHAALRVVAELGKARAAAYALGLFTEDTAVEEPQDEALDFQEAMGHKTPREKVKVDALLGQVMESVRIVTACESIYVRAQALKAMVWMQGPHEPAEELKATLAGELRDPEWTAPVLNDLLMTLHARFQATPSMAVLILDLANLFITHVPAKVDPNTLQALWKTCLVGCGPEGKQLALEAVSAVLDLPPPVLPPLNAHLQQQQQQQQGQQGDGGVGEQPSRSDVQAAVAMRRILQSAIWFLGENANFAASEYAWESATPPGAALMLLDAERMVAAAGVRNPTLAAASARLQRCAITGSWEERVVAANALMTIALRSGEPYRLQIYEFFHALMYGGGSSRKVRGMAMGVSNGEDRGASGTGLAPVIGSMLKVLDEMYRAQDQMMKDIRQHEFSKDEWREEELVAVYEMHERLTDLAMLFCFVPRTKYLPLGPISARLVYQGRMKVGADAAAGRNDSRLKESLQKLLSYITATSSASAASTDAAFPPISLLEPIADLSLSGEQGKTAGRAPDEDAPETPRKFVGLTASNFDDALYAASLLRTDEDAESALSDGSDSPTPSVAAAAAAGNIRNWDEESLHSTPPVRPRDSNSQHSGELTSLSLGNAHRGGSDSGAGAGSVSYVGGMDFDEEYDSELRARASAAAASGTLQAGKALYKFVAGDEDELSLEVGDDFEIEYEADGWYHVRKKNGDSGFVPALYVKVG